MKEITEAYAARLLPIVAQDANKYTRGVCELMVGSEQFPGAAVLASMAANRMGAGYVKAYTCPQAAAALHAAQPSVVSVSPSDYVGEYHASDAYRPRAAVVGCGMTSSDADAARTLDVLGYAAAPVLVDGGGLSALVRDEVGSVLRSRFVEGFPTVITPHGGEARRLAQAVPVEGREGVEVGELTPAELAILLARAYGAVCVLKGPDTFVASGDEEREDEVLALTSSTCALAKAGTGDVLAGCIGALLAQGIDAMDACALGVYVHARAGVRAAIRFGEFCVTAEDVVAHLPAAIGELASQER